MYISLPESPPHPAFGHLLLRSTVLLNSLRSLSRNWYPQGEGKSILSSDMPFCKVRASNNLSYSFLHMFVKCIFEIRKAGAADGDHAAVVENGLLISEARHMI